VDGSPEAFGGLTLATFTERLASAEPVPGGGSASAIAAALAASLVAMVARLSLDRPKYEPYRVTSERALEVADRARRRLLELADEDARAYAAFSAARKLPRDTPEQASSREAASQAAARKASDVPLAILRECVDIMEAVSVLAGRSNLNAASDLEVAARLAAAAGRGAAANVLINLPMVGDEAYAGGTTATVTGLVHDIDHMLSAITELVATGSLREPQAE